VLFPVGRQDGHTQVRLDSLQQVRDLHVCIAIVPVPDHPSVIEERVCLVEQIQSDPSANKGA